MDEETFSLIHRFIISTRLNFAFPFCSDHFQESKRNYAATYSMFIY